MPIFSDFVFYFYIYGLSYAKKTQIITTYNNLLTTIFLYAKICPKQVLGLIFNLRTRCKMKLRNPFKGLTKKEWIILSCSLIIVSVSNLLAKNPSIFNWGIPQSRGLSRYVRFVQLFPLYAVWQLEGRIVRARSLPQRWTSARFVFFRPRRHTTAPFPCQYL